MLDDLKTSLSLKNDSNAFFAMSKYAFFSDETWRLQIYPSHINKKSLKYSTLNMNPKPLHIKAPVAY